jgi:hypothetical protein
MRRALLLSAAIAGFLLPAQALAARHGPDFNGDGNQDVVAGIPGEDVGLAADAGAVQILYAQGARSSAAVVPGELFTQNSPGIANESEAGDRFGASLAWGNFDHDGFDGFHDLAIGVPGESLGAATGTGAVVILYGSPNGLTATRSQFWHQNVAEIDDATESGDSFGAALAAGRVDGDGFEDLLTGVPGESGFGAVSLIRGSPTGLTAANDQLVSQDSDGADGSGEPGDGYGSALASGDFNGDGKFDAVVGVPGEDVGAGIIDAGAIQVVPGSATGLQPSADKFFSQDSAGIQDTADEFDRFGGVLTAGRFDTDPTHEDVAIGVPREQQPGQEGFQTGAVHVLYGSPTGVGAARSQYFTQDSPGLDGSDPSEPEEFGSALAAGNFGTISADNLAVGAPGEEVGEALDAGSVTILKGSDSGLTSTGAQFITQDTPDVADQAEDNDEFGAALGGSDMDDAFSLELVVGAPGETLGSVLFAGAANSLVGGRTALTGSGGQFIHQSTPNVPDFPEEEDRFASVLVD